MADIYTTTTIKFPIEINGKGGPVILTGIPAIEQSLKQCLEDEQESNYFNRKYGSELFRLQFEPNDTIFKGMAHYFIRESIESNEPRLIYNPNQTIFDTSPGQPVKISINTTIQSSGQPINQDSIINRNQ